ncbi:MAG: hypothetical protein U0575_09150 [Phycisphaerales bacterium]
MRNTKPLHVGVVAAVLAAPMALAETWPTGSTIIVPSDYLVTETLVIEPGVTVKLGAGVSLSVAASGTLLADGSAASPVLFTSQGDERWGGIKFLPGSNGQLVHATIGHTAARGIRIEGAFPTIERCRVEDVAGTLAETSARGIEIVGVGANPVIRRCAIDGVVGYGNTAGNCCVAHAGAGCTNGACQGLVCEIDSFCCDVSWDGICASEAGSLCDGCPGWVGAAGANGSNGSAGPVGTFLFPAGGDGGGGGAATSGGAGGAAGWAYGIEVRQGAAPLIADNTIDDVRGGTGGDGGQGGEGGDGGAGGAGFVGVIPGDGGDGGNGAAGKPGGVGGAGGAARGIQLWDMPSASTCYQNVITHVIAGDGGVGGNGGAGGKGGKGGAGASCSNFCPAGDGGDGGNGGAGGAGANGGAGGTARAFDVQNATGLVTLAHNTAAAIANGVGGAKGDGGAGGAKGAGGAAGTSPTGPDGSPGAAGSNGAGGAAGVVGAAGDTNGVRANGASTSVLAHHNILELDGSVGTCLLAGGSAQIDTDYNCFWGFVTYMSGDVEVGFNDLVADPQLADPRGADAHPIGSSPVINAGLNAIIVHDVADIDGDGNTLEPVPLDIDDNPRVSGGVVDLGAFEFNACPADLDGDGVVDGGDLGLLLGSWGGAGAGDIDGNGVVDGADMGLLLAAWGDC